MDRLGELQTLVAIVDSGSLAAAARRLGRSPPAVTRDLADLERRIGMRLVERSTRSCRATPAGTRLADQARQVLSGYNEAIGRAAEEKMTARGLLRVTAPITFGANYVSPLITDFLDTYPEVRIDLQLIDRSVDLIEEEFDLAVRIGRSADGSLRARVVGETRRMVVASPAYLQSKGTPVSPRDLARHDVVQHTSRGINTPWTFRGPAGRPILFALTPRFTVNQPEVAIAAARDGRGVVSVLYHQVEADLRAGSLVRILKQFEPDGLPVSILYPESRGNWHRIRLMVDHLAKGLSALDVIRRDD